MDVDCGAGIDSLIAAGMVVATGRVSLEMLEKARRPAAEAGRGNVEFRYGYG